MKPESKIDFLIYSCLVAVSVAVLVLVALSLSFFLKDDVVYGKF